jgi:tetratricopeptide (TPR) repeat protein
MVTAMTLESDRLRARRLAIAGDFGAEALALNLELLRANADDNDARTRLARCYREAGRVEDAQVEYREVLRQDPKNRIAAGALDDLTLGGLSAASLVTRPIPRSFTGFRQQDFAELQVCPAKDIRKRFAPRVIDLVRRINALPSSQECAGARDPQQRTLFRAGPADVHPYPRHWYVFNLGGRWEPQFNIGMFSGDEVVGDWFRIGIGMNLTLDGRSPDPEAGREQVRFYLRRFRQLLRSERRHLLTAWLAREGGRVQFQIAPPKLDLRDPGKAADLVANCIVENTDWTFYGKWLVPHQPEDARILADPVALVRLVDRVFTGLLPLYRAILGHA